MLNVYAQERRKNERKTKERRRKKGKMIRKGRWEGGKGDKKGK